MKNTNQQGSILVQTLVFSGIAVMFLTGLVSWTTLNLKSMKQTVNREVAMHIAEAGIDYYRWHLAHAPQDFKDGTGVPGPYFHTFKDKDGVVLGGFSLTITPPVVGSTIVTIRSTGTSSSTPPKSRTIETKMAIPSWAKFAVAANDYMRFGEGTEVFGAIHSNKGIRFDGVTHNLVTSSLASYDDPDHGGGVEFGVHTHVAPVDPLPPVAVPNRADVFMAGRQFPVAAVDFAGITANLAQIKADAISGGKYFAPSGLSGYHVILKNNDTFDLYKVKALANVPNGCANDLTQTGWGSWSIKSGGNNQQFVANYAIPANGLIFLEDNVWVDGLINTVRVTIASGKFPDNAATRTSITINNDLLYTNYDGQDSIALIAQNNINAGLFSEDDLRVDGALIAQNGRVGRFYYNNNCSPNDVRTKITLYGTLASNQRYGFAYTDGSGYQTRNIIYDANMLYSPPPSFPLTSDQYQMISWKEID
jgi:hypothetical protein